ncbi:MAG: peptidase S10 [Acidobacteria bacterium]|nr:peptidase S10 [Acidobacteriota bacterium]
MAADEAPVSRPQHIELSGRTLNYTSTTGMMPVRNAQGETEANMFFIAYTLDGVADRSRRKLMFCFNGGPGSSSVWLHLGAFGPKRIRMLDDGSMPPPPYRMEVNPATWLDETDMVFVDPVGTGYSRAVKPDLAKKFFGVQGDIESVGEFIRMYLTRYERWMSPLFLAGESYGTTRAAGLAGHMVEKGVAFNGIFLISAILNFATVRGGRSNDLNYVMHLPVYAATAWYHRKATGDLRQLLNEVEAFAIGPYQEALAKGDQLAPTERSAIAAKLSRYTGLDPKFLERAELRIELNEFQRELLRGQNLLVGRLDSRLTGPGTRDNSARAEFDPSMTAIRPPYTAAFNHYVRAELGYKSDAPYHILGGGIGPWDWGPSGTVTDVSDALRQGLAKNPHMKVYVGQGLFDFATPYFAAGYTLGHMGLHPKLRGNIRIYQYESGHMYYIHVPSLKKMKSDAAEFLRWAAPEN